MSHTFFKKMFSLDSMRSRYMMGAMVLSLLFIASVWLTHVFISRAVRDTAQSSAYRNEFVESHRLIREHLWRAEYAMQTYLFTPEQGEYKRVVENLEQAAACVADVPHNRWTHNAGMDMIIEQLARDLEKLKTGVNQLMNLRKDPQLLFPAYATINDVMLPQNLQFISQIQLVLDDLSGRLGEAEIQSAYHQFNLIKDEWLDMVSAFRIYVASRAMTIREPSQDNNEFETVIELHQANLLSQIKTLSTKIEKADFGLQAEASIGQLSELLVTWFKAYKEVKIIYSSRYWRMDEILMSDRIQPMQEVIWNRLHQIEQVLGHSSQQDVDQLAEVASDVNSVLWIRMLLALLFIGTAFLAFEHWVLRPVAKIAHALKMEADGEEVEELPRANTLETRELVDAFSEMRAQVKVRQYELEHQALHDNLTGLPNRLLLRRRLVAAIDAASRKQSELALLMVDLDRFKEINDTLGHHMGDRVLKEIGPRFKAELLENDMLARLGGDEFAILLPDADVNRANDVASRLSQSLDIDFNMDGQLLRVGSSIGIALYPHHGVNEQSLLQRADVAMYLAKHKNIGFAVYDENQDEHSVWQLSFEGELHRAIREDLLELHYQPKVDVASNAIVGVEALLRWNHPLHGLVPADEIHLLAEKTGLIKPLTKWVVSHVVQQLAAWARKDIHLHVSANLSVWNLQDPKLYECVRESLRECNVPANRLLLEITESAVMSDPDSAMDTLVQLSRLGIRLSIDDFGIGFSSLQYLKKLPVNELKIDKSFVMDMIVDENNAVIVRSTIDLAHNLGLRVIAEGVESQEIYDVLQILGCDEAQGFHMARPMTSEQLEKWMYQSKWGLSQQARLQVVR